MLSPLWLRAHALVDAARVAMIGSSYGGVMVMLAAGRRAPFRAGISFAGPSITWPDAPALQTVLLDAMGMSEVPLMLIQAGDDVHLTPSYVLGSELARLGKPHEYEIYGPSAKSPATVTASSTRPSGSGEPTSNASCPAGPADHRRSPPIAFGPRLAVADGAGLVMPTRRRVS